MFTQGRRTTLYCYYSAKESDANTQSSLGAIHAVLNPVRIRVFTVVSVEGRHSMRDLRASSGDNVINIDDEEADRVFTALSADSARELLSTLNDGPATVSELAEVTGLTPQNVSYHLGNLDEAELVEPVETDASENGATVYAPARSITVSTETEGKRRQYPVSAVGILVGGLLTVVCLLSVVDPHFDLLAIVGYGLGLLKFV